MEITKVNYALVVYLAMIEGLSLFVLDILRPYPFDLFVGFIVGFIPSLAVLIAYRLIAHQFPIKINGMDITKLPILFLSALKAVFIELLFVMQSVIPSPGNMPGYSVFGFLSVLIASLVLIFIYNKLDWKISLEVNQRIVKLKNIKSPVLIYKYEKDND